MTKIFAGILVFLSVYSCKKEEPEHFRLSAEFKRWTVFNVGSYWIFQNDSTFQTDSVFVKEPPRVLDAPAYSSKDNFTMEWIEMSYSSAFLKSTTQNVREGGMETYSISINNNVPVALIASGSDNFIPYYNYENTGAYTYQLLFQDSVFYLGPKKYNNVVCTQFTKSGEKLTCWFAKDIGLIKVSGENTVPAYSWSLLRYQLGK